MNTNKQSKVSRSKFAKGQYVIRVAVEEIENMLSGSAIELSVRSGWIAKIRIAMNMKQAELSSPDQTIEDLEDWLETYQNRRSLGRQRIQIINDAVRLIKKHLEIMEKALKGTDFEASAQRGWIGQIREALNMEHYPLTNTGYSFRDMAGQIWKA